MSLDPVEPEAELKKLRFEYDRKEAEARRAHARELQKLAIAHRNADKNNRIATASQRENEAKKAADAAKAELNKLVHQKMADVAAAGVDRARDGAKFVQTAATAIFAVYTGLLALVYSVTDNPLPLRGAWAGMFLGMAVAFATAYLAFLTNPLSEKDSHENKGLAKDYPQISRLSVWVEASIHSGRYATRAGVISLFFGVLFIAAPFVSTVPATTVTPAPTAPLPPAEVAPGFDVAALDLFESQIEDYNNAVDARATALAAAAETADERAAREQELNRQVSWAALAGLMVVLLVPFLYGGLERVKAKWEEEHAKTAGG